MITFQLSLTEKIAAQAMQDAVAHDMSFPEYVEWRLNAPMNEAGQIVTPPALPQNAAEVAGEIFKIALMQPLRDVGTEGDLASRPYLVEALYRQMAVGNEWAELDRGFRIMIGKAFRREVDAQKEHGGKVIDDETGLCVKVMFLRRNAQNQALYRTVRTG